MNTYARRLTPCCKHARPLLVACMLSLGFAGKSVAADWYLNKNQAVGTNWNQSADWDSPTGTHPGTLPPGDSYHIRQYQLRTPDSAGFSTFPGTLLDMNSPNSRITVKAPSGGGAIIPNLLATGGGGSTGMLDSGTTGSVTLQVGQFENRSGNKDLRAASGSSMTLNITGALTGSGALRVYGGGTIHLQGDASSYLGDLSVTQGTLHFNNAFNTAGKLIIDSTAGSAKISLDQNVTFTGLTIAGAAQPVTTYDYATLRASYPSVFPAGGSGSITVRTPLTWYLAASQTSTDWDSTSDWRANADGTGAVAPSVNIIDTYVNQSSGRVMRTPSASSTFKGASLKLDAGAVLDLALATGQTGTVRAVNGAGSATVNGAAGVTQTLAVSKWTQTSGAVTLAPSSGGVMQLRIDELIGAGSFTLGGAGEVRPYLGHAHAFGGTVTVGSGAKLAVQADNPMAFAGSLVVNSGATVVLGDWIHCTALTVNGTAKAVGTYDAAALGAGFSGTGRIAVYVPDTAGPPQMFGVNLAGAEFDGATAFWQTNPVVWDYYQSKGLTLVRMPVKWSRIQAGQYGAVTFTQMDQCIALARDRGMKVILDLHSYGSITEAPPRLGAPEQPVEVMVDVWDKLSAHYANEPAIFGYDLMNEPIIYNDSVATWADALQKTVNRIRRNDRTHYVFVEGMGASNAKNWIVGSTYNALLDIKDPSGRLIYSAHSYWDYQSNPYAGTPYYANDGNYRSDDVPNPAIGTDHVAPFIAWLQTRPYAHGHIGEYAVPQDNYSADWNIALGNFLALLRAQNISGTYWAGGENWGNSPTAIHPYPFPGADEPQMAVLGAYNNARPAGDVYLDNTMSGTDVTFLPNVASWIVGNFATGQYSINYQTDGNTGKGTKSAIFTPNLPVAGNYDVFLRWSTNSTWANNAPVSVAHAGTGSPATMTVNERVLAANNVNGWNPLGTYAFNAGKSGSVTIANSTTDGGTVIADAVWFRASTTLPSPWTGADIGSVGVAGSSTHLGGVFTVKGSGTTIGGTADSFQFAYQTVTGDFTLTARVASQTNTNSYARAGVMVRDGLAANAKFADAIVTPSSGAYLQYRSSVGGTATSTASGAAIAPYWVRVQRAGNVFTAYKSADNVSWTAMGSPQTITMGSSVQVGLAVSSLANTTLCTATFDNVTLTP